MSAHTSRERLAGILMVIFAGAMTVVCGGCRDTSPETRAPEQIDEPEAHTYVSQKMGALTVNVPQNLRENAAAANTFEYMARTAAAVGLCTDERNFRGDAAQQARATERAKDRMLDLEVVEYIRDLPSDHVDPSAKKAVMMLADNFDKMDEYHQAVQNAQINASVKWAQVLFGIMDDTSSTDDFDVDKTADIVMDKVGTGDAVTIKKAVGGYAEMQQIAHETYDRLATARKELSVKYHASFPEIRLNTDYRSRCDLPWYF